jgi:predicted Kef-type K+ transport protein
MSILMQVTLNWVQQSAIYQNDKPIALYSRKLNPAQTRYTTTEPLNVNFFILLKHSKSFIIYYLVVQYAFSLTTNILPTKISTQNVSCDGLLIDEFGPELIYIKGTSNVVADALSRLNITLDPMSRDQTVVADLYGGYNVSHHIFQHP